MKNYTAAEGRMQDITHKEADTQHPRKGAWAARKGVGGRGLTLGLTREHIIRSDNLRHMTRLLVDSWRPRHPEESKQQDNDR